MQSSELQWHGLGQTVALAKGDRIPEIIGVFVVLGVPGVSRNLASTVVDFVLAVSKMVITEKVNTIYTHI